MFFAIRSTASWCCHLATLGLSLARTRSPFGYEVFKTGFWEIPPGADEYSFADGIGEFIRAYGKDLEIKRADGRVLLASSNKTPLGGYVLTFTDITDSRRAEEKRLEDFNEIVQSTDHGLALFDHEGRFVLANKALREFFQPSGIELEPGRRVDEMHRWLIEQDFYVIPDGMSKDTFYADSMEAIYDFSSDYLIESTSGRVCLSSVKKTELGGFLLSYRDVTELRKAEAELARQRDIAHQNEKLSALGELLAGVAHELNNPLSVVFGYAQMLEGRVDDPVVAKRLDLIRQSAERAAKIVKTFLAMARQRPTKVEVCSINSAVRTAVEVSSYTLTSNGTRVTLDLDEGVPPVQGDFDQLAQVFTNLIVNAGHAVEPQGERGQLTLKSFYDPLAEHVVVEVRDNGPGIPEDIQPRIFEPFFTTKDVGEGTGVGLAFSYRIVETHGGSLELETARGEGTSMLVKLPPLIDEDKATVDTAQPELVRQPMSVLVLDDEVGVAQLIDDLLTEEGLAVTHLTHPRNALRLLEQRTFDVILSDFKMPGMNGQDFFEALKVTAPECAERIGFVTGDAMGASVKAFFDVSQRPFIEKPISKGDLIALVHQLYHPQAEG